MFLTSEARVVLSVILKVKASLAELSVEFVDQLLGTVVVQVD
jgi:hypothetical protein